MIPSDIETFTTDGEKTFYRFLQTCAQPNDRYLAWYLPQIAGHEPDFILYAQDIGMTVFEVKDWSLDQILAADTQCFTLYINGKEERRQNPYAQVREYFGNIMDMIKKDGLLVSKEPHAYGHVKVTVNTGIVFPHINKYEYEEKGLHHIIESDRIFFWDDLNPQSPICSDPTGQHFREALDRVLKVKPRFTITGKELNHLRQLIFPEVRIDLPSRGADSMRVDEARRLKILDHNQESIARQYAGGHRIIQGPSGTGKTLILVHRAALLKRYNPAVRNILFVCYNITLVNYIRRLLADKHAPFGKDGVDVLHFFELCNRITGENYPFENEDPEFFDMIINEAKENLASCNIRYDAIMIDEGQDFSDDMLKIVMALLNPQTNHLAIAVDDNQNIYGHRTSWRAVGIQARGRVHKLSWIYRNTKEIADFARALIDETPATSQESSSQMLLFPEVFEAMHGPHPNIKLFPDYSKIVAWVADRISILNIQEGYPLSEIAILYTMKSPPHDSAMHLPNLLGAALEKKGILYHWIAEDYRAKKSYDVTTDRVAISTIHSAKGFDYGSVFLIGLDWLEPGRWSEDQIHKLTYVAVTRARKQLFIPYCYKSNLICNLLDSCNGSCN